MDINKRGKHHVWTDEQDTILVNHVAESNGVLTEAYKSASEQLGIDASRCKSRWYNHLAPILGNTKESTSTRKTKNKKSVKSAKNKKIEDDLPSSEASFALSQGIRDSLDGFLDSMKLLQKQNKMLNQRIADLEKRLTEQSRIMRDMSHERKELDENYTYILKVMEKARKMFAEEEVREAVHKVDSHGSVEITKTDRKNEQRNSAG